MERLSSYEADRLNDALYGMDVDGGERVHVSARYVRTDGDGTPWVRFEGADKDTPLTSPMSVRAVEGDLIDVSLGGYEATGGGNRTDPSAGFQDVRAVNVEVERIKGKQADFEKVTAKELEAEKARLGDVEADTAKIHELTAEQLAAATAYIASLTASSITASSLAADIGKIHTLTAEQLSAAAAYIAALTAGSVTAQNIIADHGDFATVKANAAKVANLTAAQLEADHATVANLDTNYAHIDLANVDNAWIVNGTIKDGAISSAMINDVSANKLTAGTINGSVINVTNLNADNITTGTINGQRIGEGSLGLDKLSEDVYTEAEVDAKLSTMQAEIDGAIETWTGTEVPTLNNAPASNWSDAAMRDTHVGDVYFVVNSQSQQNGYNYRFTKTGSTYSWQLIKDSDVTNALSRLSTAEGKITTFESDISTLQTDTGSLTTRTTSLETRADGVDQTLLDKVDITDFNEVSNTVDGHTSALNQMTQTISNKADGSTVTALTTRVNKNETDISGINTTIGELQTTVASKADGSALTTVSNKLNTVSDTVDGHTQTISSVQSTLATKADNSTVSTLRSEYNETKTTVAGHETRLGATESMANGVRADLKSVELASENLVSNFATSWQIGSLGSSNYGYSQSAGRIIQVVSENEGRVWDVKANTRYVFKATNLFDDTTKIYVGVHEQNVDGTHLKDSLWQLCSAGGYKFTTLTNTATIKLVVRDGDPDGAVPVSELLTCIADGSLVFSLVEDLETEVTTLKTDYATYKQTTTESLTQVGNRMTTAEGKISTAETNIASNANAISLKASQSEVDTLTDRVASAESSISVQAGQISSKVSQSDFNNLEGRVDTAESTIQQQAGQISAKVSKDGVIAAINLSTETEGGSAAKISADKVHINGTAIFSAISSDVNNAITSKGYATTDQVSAAQTAATTAANQTTDQKLASYSTTQQMNDAIGDAVDAIEVGGRNLVVQATRRLGRCQNGSDNAYTNGADDGQKHWQSAPIPVTAGETYVFTTYGWTEEISHARYVAMHFTTEDLTWIGCPVMQAWAPAFENYTWIVTAPTNAVYARVSAPKEAYETKLKLEKGSKATDWTPAPEDTDAAIASVKANAVKRTQRIYYRKNASGAPATPGTASSAWVTVGNDGSHQFNKWTTKIPRITANADGTGDKYLYLYTCEQREMADGTLAYTTVLLDDSNTIIDGGNIITGTVTANKLDANSINASNVLTIGALTIDAAADVLNSSLDDRFEDIDSSMASLEEGLFGYDVESEGTETHVDGAIDTINNSISGVQTTLSNKVDEDAVINAINNSTEQSGAEGETPRPVLISGAKLDIATNVSFQGLTEIANAKIDMVQATALFAQMLTAAQVQVGAIESVHIEQRGNRFSFLMPGKSLPNVTDEELDQHSDTAFEGEVAFISVNTDTSTSTFYMNQSVVLNDLRFGDWKWHNRANKHMTLQYVGEVNS